MKIGIFVQDISKLGGVETVSVWLAKRLSQDNSVDIVSCGNVSKTFYNFDKDVKINYLNLNNKNNYTREEYNTISDYFEKSSYDKVIIQLSTVFKNLCKLADAKIYKIISKYSDVYVVLHESPRYFLKRYNTTQDNKFKFLLKVLYTKVYYNPQIIRFFKKSKKIVKSFITLSNGCRKELIENFNIDSLVRYNPYAFDNNDEISNLNKENIILWAGRFSPEKNIPFLLETWEKIKNHNGWKLLLIGDGADRNRIENFITGNKIKDVELIAAIPHDELISYFKRSKIFIFSSFFEGFPTVISEAMNYKNAVISTRYDGYSDELLDSETGFILDYNSEKFANKLQMLIDNEELLYQFQNKGFERCKKFYSNLYCDFHYFE